ncbi:hypothetical protein BC832DRAFT_257512 [Gaertneriomyces semiglobifer]|nr:hypothetical protein BC832DRAFT_257512 [Gaertneriomyces semiglobifer]
MMGLPSSTAAVAASAAALASAAITADTITQRTHTNADKSTKDASSSPSAPAATGPTTSTSLSSYTRAQIRQHTTAKSLWVIFNHKVYDVTEFMFDHPGGEEFLLQYGGEDITSVMADESAGGHVHSEGAYEVLDEYCIGVVRKEGDAEQDHDDEGADHLAPLSTQSILGKKQPFIDLSLPMLAQMWSKNFSKEFYLTQVHIPRHVPYSAPIFGHPLLEMFTKTPWWVIPILWVPIWMTAIYFSVQLQGVSATMTLGPAGVILWTLLEYGLHRFVFHVDKWLPDNRLALTAHFLLHGIHHYIPMDRMRLVMPPALSLFIAFCLYSLFSLFLAPATVISLATGVIPGYITYDLIHYYLHHGRPLTHHLRNMKTYHLDHHYKDPERGFGISSTWWDWGFGSLLD